MVLVAGQERVGQKIPISLPAVIAHLANLM
jgi:hypothetical protein